MAEGCDDASRRWTKEELVGYPWPHTMAGLARHHQERPGRQWPQGGGSEAARLDPERAESREGGSQWPTWDRTHADDVVICTENNLIISEVIASSLITKEKAIIAQLMEEQDFFDRHPYISA